MKALMSLHCLVLLVSVLCLASVVRSQTVQPFPGWDSVSESIEGPRDVVIDYSTGDIYITMLGGKSLDVLLKGQLPKITIYQENRGLLGAELIHRTCAGANQPVYGMFFTVPDQTQIFYLPLPLPQNPSVTNVAGTVQMVATGLWKPYWLTQTHNSMQLYVVETDAGNSGARVSHWEIMSPSIGKSVPGLQFLRYITNVGTPQGIAITRDDNTLFVSVPSQNKVFRVTPLLSGTPGLLQLNGLNGPLGVLQPSQILLHPLYSTEAFSILFIANSGAGDVILYNSSTGHGIIFASVNTTGGHRPVSVALQPNGTLIIVAQDGLKTVCCTDPFDPLTTLAAYRNGIQCLPATPVPFPGWAPISYILENPIDAVIDHNTGDIFVSFLSGKRIVVLLGGALPKITIYSGTAAPIGIELIHRQCGKQMLYGLFIASHDTSEIKYLPLPLPPNPSVGNVLVKTALTQTSDKKPYFLVLTHNSLQLYVTNPSRQVNHYDIVSPSGETVPSLRQIRIILIREASGVAITKDDNILFVSVSPSSSDVYKVTPLLYGMPKKTILTFKVDGGSKLLLHPLHNSRDDAHLYVGNVGEANILKYETNTSSDTVFIQVPNGVGVRPRGIQLFANGTIIMIAEDGLRVTCCVEPFDPFTTLAAYRSVTQCSPSDPVQFPGWGIVAKQTENPIDVIIDYETGHLFVTMWAGKRIDILLNENLPKTTIYTSSFGGGLVSGVVMHRTCSGMDQLIHGLFFSEYSGTINLVRFLLLPLPQNPSVSNVGAMVETVLSDLLQPHWIVQTFNSMQLYVAEYASGGSDARVSHWGVLSPSIGKSVPTLQFLRYITNVGTPQGIAITRDDNTLFVSSFGYSIIYKATSMLNATPTISQLSMTQAIYRPMKLELHPLFNSNEEDFVLYFANSGKGNIVEVPSIGIDKVLMDVTQVVDRLPNGITLLSNGSIIIVAQDGLKTSCCVAPFDPFTTLAAYRNNTPCLPVASVPFPGWGSVNYTLENPIDVGIDFLTGNIYVSMFHGKRLDVLLHGTLPKITIYSSTGAVMGVELMHRYCGNQRIYGVFFTQYKLNILSFIPLPLPSNPTELNVGATVQTVASGFQSPGYLTQTYNSLQLYIAEYNNGISSLVSHLAVGSPAAGEVAPSMGLIRTITDVGVPVGVAITRNDNILFVSSSVERVVYKVAPMLSATPISTVINFMRSTPLPQNIFLHPLHNTAIDYVFYVALRGRILLYDSKATGGSTVFMHLNSTAGYRPHGILLFQNGTIILANQDGLKASCCLEAFDPFSTLAAYRNVSQCLPSPAVQLPGLTLTDITDAAIDHSTGDMFIIQKKRLSVLLRAGQQSVTLYTSSSAGPQFVGGELIHRRCHSGVGQLIYGLFFTEAANNILNFLPLPLPANPSEATVASTVRVVASTLISPHWLVQTFNSVQLYVADFKGGRGARVSHWAVVGPPFGESVPSVQLIRTVAPQIIDPIGVALTRDDNILFISGYVTASIYKMSPMLTDAPTVAVLHLRTTLQSPQKLLLHPLYNTAEHYILYVGNLVGKKIVEFNSQTGIDFQLIGDEDERLHGISLYANGSIVIIAEAKLKISCCVEAFDPFTTLAAYRNNMPCWPSAPVPFPGWALGNENNIMDVAIDHDTGDMYITTWNSKSLIVLQKNGNVPNSTIYSSTTSMLVGAGIIHRSCFDNGTMIYGLFFAELAGHSLKYLPLPLPRNPSRAIVSPSINTVATGLLAPCWFTQTYHSIQLYVAEFNSGKPGALVSHWQVTSTPTVGLRLIRQIKNAGFPNGVAITRDDNALFVSSITNDAMYKLHPLLPGVTPPFIVTLVINGVLGPQKILLHPVYNSPTNYQLLIGNLGGGNIGQYRVNGNTTAISTVLFAQTGVHGVSLLQNGSIIVNTEDGLKITCCVNSFDARQDLPYSTCSTTTPSRSVTKSLVAKQEEPQLNTPSLTIESKMTKTTTVDSEESKSKSESNISETKFDPSSFNSASSRTPEIGISIELSKTIVDSSSPPPPTANNVNALNITVVEDPVAAKITKAEVAVVTASTASVVAVNTFSSAAYDSGVGGNEMQSIVVLGLMQCSRPGMKKLTGDSKRAVVPLTVGDSPLSGVYGCLVLMAGVLTLHCLVTLVWTALRKQPIEKSSADTHFPSISFSVMMLLYQGLTFEASVLTFAGDGSTPIAAVVLALAVLVPLAGAWWVKTKCDVSYMAYQHIFQKQPALMKRFILPSDTGTARIQKRNALA